MGAYECRNRKGGLWYCSIRHATLVSVVFRIQCTLWICLWLMADITFTDRNYNDRQNLLTTYSVVVAILNAQNDITFVIVAPSAHLSANSQERWFWLIVVLPEVLIQHHFEATKGWGSDLPLCMHSSHGNTFSLLCLRSLLVVLTKSLSIHHLMAHNCLEEISPTCSCLDHVIMKVWLANDNWSQHQHL